jgi:hypothetical protein
MFGGIAPRATCFTTLKMNVKVNSSRRLTDRKAMCNVNAWTANLQRSKTFSCGRGSGQPMQQSVTEKRKKVPKLGSCLTVMNSQGIIIASTILWLWNRSTRTITLCVIVNMLRLQKEVHERRGAGTIANLRINRTNRTPSTPATATATASTTAITAIQAV